MNNYKKALKLLKDKLKLAVRPYGYYDHNLCYCINFFDFSHNTRGDSAAITEEEYAFLAEIFERLKD